VLSGSCPTPDGESDQPEDKEYDGKRPKDMHGEAQSDENGNDE
jgi:hypothetical protein